MPVTTRYAQTYEVTSGAAWTNPTNVYVADGVRNESPATGLCIIKHTFGFSSAVIPDGSTINDVEFGFAYLASTLGGTKTGAITLTPGSASQAVTYDNTVHGHTLDAGGGWTWQQVRDGTLYAEATNWVTSGTSVLELDYMFVQIDWTVPEFQIP